MLSMAWIATYTSPLKEAAATKWLSSLGETVCCPTTNSLIRRKIPKTERYAVSYERVPVFPCYIFAKVSDALYSAMHNPPMRVGRLIPVRAGRTPIEVPDKVIDTIAGEYAGDTVVAPEGIRPGAMVRLALAAGITVEVSSIARLEKYREVTVWLQMLGLRRESNYPLELISVS